MWPVHGVKNKLWRLLACWRGGASCDMWAELGIMWAELCKQNIFVVTEGASGALCVAAWVCLKAVQVECCTNP